MRDFYAYTVQNVLKLSKESWGHQGAYLGVHDEKFLEFLNIYPKNLEVRTNADC